MSYRPNNTKRNILIGVLFAAAAASVLYAWGPEIRYGVSSAAQYVAEPLWKAGARVSGAASSYTAIIDSKEALKQKNRELDQEIQELRLRLLTKDLLLQENKELKSLLGRLDSRVVILAEVLSRPNRSPYDTLIIDIGKDKGVQEGDTVLVAGEIRIGDVSEVYLRSSKVELYSSPGRTEHVVVGANAIPAVAKGKGSGNFEITLPRDVPVAEGDAVTIPDMETTMIGIVSYIGKDPNSPFQTILAKSPVNFYDLEWVQVDVSSFDDETVQ